jgi:hypothetical protein
MQSPSGAGRSDPSRPGPGAVPAGPGPLLRATPTVQIRAIRADPFLVLSGPSLPVCSLMPQAILLVCSLMPQAIRRPRAKRSRYRPSSHVSPRPPCSRSNTGCQDCKLSRPRIPAAPASAVRIPLAFESPKGSGRRRTGALRGRARHTDRLAVYPQHTVGLGDFASRAA